MIQEHVKLGPEARGCLPQGWPQLQLREGVQLLK